MGTVGVRPLEAVPMGRLDVADQRRAGPQGAGHVRVPGHAERRDDLRDLGEDSRQGYVFSSRRISCGMTIATDDPPSGSSVGSAASVCGVGTQPSLIRLAEELDDVEDRTTCTLHHPKSLMT